MSFLYSLTNKECIELAKAYHPDINPTVEFSDSSVYIKDKQQNIFLNISIYGYPTRFEIFSNKPINENLYYAFNDANSIHDYVCRISYYSNERNEYKSLLPIPRNASEATTSLLSEKERLYNELNLKAGQYDYSNSNTAFLDFFTEGEIEKIEVLEDNNLFFDHPRMELIIKKLIEINYRLFAIRNKQDFVNALRIKYAFNQFNFGYSEHEFDKLIELYEVVYCNPQQPELLISQFSPRLSFEKAKLIIEKQGFVFTQTSLNITELKACFDFDNELKIKSSKLEKK